MKHFLHLLALWKPPQHVVDGKLHKDQPYIEHLSARHEMGTKYSVSLRVWDAELKDWLIFGAEFTEATMAEKRGAFGHYLVTTLGAKHAEARAAVLAPPPN